MYCKYLFRYFAVGVNFDEMLSFSKNIIMVKVKGKVEAEVKGNPSKYKALIYALALGFANKAKPKIDSHQLAVNKL